MLIGHLAVPFSINTLGKLFYLDLFNFFFEGNLLENANLKPQSGWQGNHTDRVEFSSWKIIANDGDGIQLEKEANGT